MKKLFTLVFVLLAVAAMLTSCAPQIGASNCKAKHNARAKEVRKAMHTKAPALYYTRNKR